MTERAQREAQVAKVLLDFIGVKGLLRALVDYGYEYGYQEGDGISYPIRCYAQLNFQGLKMRHPGGVMHDPGYAEGLRHPLLPARFRHDEHGARQWFDWEFGDVLYAVGSWRVGRATTWPLGLRAFGWVAWNHYRNEEKAGRFGHIRNMAVQRAAILQYQTAIGMGFPPLDDVI